MVSPEENQYSGHRFGPILAKAAFVAAATPTILFLGERADQALADTGTSVSTTSDNGHQTVPDPQNPAGSGGHGSQVETQPNSGHNTGSGTSQAETGTASNTKNTSSQQSPAVRAVPPRPRPLTAVTVNTPATHEQAAASEAVSVSVHASSINNKNTSSDTVAPEPVVPAAQPTVASRETSTAVSHHKASTGETGQAPPSAPAPAASQESQSQQQKTDTGSAPASAKAGQSAAPSADTGVTVPERPVALVHDTQPSTNNSATGHASPAGTQQPASDLTSNTGSANTSGSPSAPAHQPQNDRHNAPPVAVPPRPVPHHDAGTAASGATETSQPADAPAPAPSPKDGMEKVGNTIYYNQHDAPWSHARFDGGSGRGDISENGCGVTTLAEVISTQSDQVVTPVQMADEVMADHLVTYDGSTYWKAMTAVPEAHGLKAEAIPVNQASLDAALAAGAEVESNGTDNDPNTPATSAGHFFDITEKAPDGNYRIADPNSRAMSAREFTAQQLLGPASFMAAVFPSHAVPAPAPPAAPAPAPASSPSSIETADHQGPSGPVHLPGGYSVNVPVPPRPVPHGNEHNDEPAVPPRPHAGGHHDQAPAPAPTAAPASEAPQQTAGLNAQQMQIINSLQISQPDKDFIAQAMQAAMDLRSQGVLINPQVMVGQAILESAYGQETPPDSNNFFGMKAPSSTPPDQISWAWTHEVINGQSVRIRAPFMKFPSVEAGLRGQAAFLAARPWFADAMTQQGAHDASYYLDHLLDGDMKYATQPNYKNEILHVIAVNHLADIDAAGSH